MGRLLAVGRRLLLATLLVWAAGACSSSGGGNGSVGGTDLGLDDDAPAIDAACPGRDHLADSVGISLGREAGEFTPHVLRHTAGTTLTRAGTDIVIVIVIVIVAEILGHSVETARRYALPSEGDRQVAIERLPVDRQGGEALTERVAQAGQRLPVVTPRSARRG